MNTIELEPHQLLVVDGARQPRLRVLRGSAWLTQEHEPLDAVLRAGDETPLRAGRVLVEALGAARVQLLRDGAAALTPQPSTRLAWARRTWRHARSRLGDAIARLQLGPGGPACG